MNDVPVKQEQEREGATTGAWSVNPDWLVRGALARLGDIFDQFTGRQWTPSSSIAASELVERLKKLLDAEAREIEGKGTVVPHHIQLKLQWEKFASDADETIERLERELLVAAADHINDSIYYTLAPLQLEIKTDYFTEGVKLYASFDDLDPSGTEGQLNVTMPSFNPGAQHDSDAPRESAERETCITFIYSIDDKAFSKRVVLGPHGRIALGRGGANDVIVDDNSVSKMHAAVSTAADGELVVADTGSTNGTFINDERIAYGKALPLGPDDRLKLGNVSIELKIEVSEKLDEGLAADEPVSIGGFEFTRGNMDQGEKLERSSESGGEHIVDVASEVDGTQEEPIENR